jgi:ubiquitin fusion degradation protein 1
MCRLNIVYPMLFKLSNKKQNRTTHCGVLEFVADEGKIYIPYWMMQNLMLDEGGLIQVVPFNTSTAQYFHSIRIWIWIRILLISSLNFKRPTKN